MKVERQNTKSMKLSEFYGALEGVEKTYVFCAK